MGGRVRLQNNIEASRMKNTLPHVWYDGGVACVFGRHRPGFWSVRRTVRDEENKEAGCRPEKAGCSMAFLSAQGVVGSEIDTESTRTVSPGQRVFMVIFVLCYRRLVLFMK